VVALIMFLILGWAQPYAIYANQALIHRIVNTNVVYFAQQQMFLRTGKEIFFIEDISRQDGVLKTIFAYSEEKSGKRITTTAQRGKFFAETGGDWPVLQLEEVVRLELEKPVTFSDPGPLPVATISFAKKQNSPLKLANVKPYRKRGLSEYEWFNEELFEGIRAKKPPYPYDRLSAEFNFRLAQIAVILLLPCFAICFSVGPTRKNLNYRIALGICAIIAFYQILVHGAVMSRTGFPASIGIWLPVAILAVCVLYGFYRICFKPPDRFS